MKISCGRHPWFSGWLKARGLMVIVMVIAWPGWVQAQEKSSPYWSYRLTKGSLSSLRYDPSGRGHYGRNLAYRPWGLKVGDEVLELTDANVSLTSAGQLLRIQPAQAKGRDVTLTWPIDFGPKGYYDRLTGRTLKAPTPDAPALTRFIGGGNGNVIMIESFKRLSVASLQEGKLTNSSLRMDESRTIQVLTTDATTFTIDVGPGGGMRFAFADEKLEAELTCKGGIVALATTPDTGYVQLEHGERLPYFTFADDLPLTTTLGGKTTLNRLYNEFYLHSSFWFPYAASGMIWGEWGAQGFSYINSVYNRDVARILSKQFVGDDGYGRDGYAYSWEHTAGWPFPGGYDTRHYMTNATQICAIRQYLLWNGEDPRMGQDFAIKGLAQGQEVFGPGDTLNETRLIKGHVFSQAFRVERPIDQLALLLRVPAIDPLTGEDGLILNQVHSTRSHLWMSSRLELLPGKSVAQVITPAKPFNTMGIAFGTMGAKDCGVRVRIFNWLGDYDQTMASHPLLQKQLINIMDNHKSYLALPQMLPAGSSLLVVLDEPIPAGRSNTCYYYVNHQRMPASPELGAMLLGNHPLPEHSLAIVPAVRLEQGGTFKVCDEDRRVIYETNTKLQPMDEYWKLSLPKPLKTGRYTLEVTSNDGMLFWRGSFFKTVYGGQARMDEHRWDWLDRARRMMNYQLQYLNGRREKVLCFDDGCGDTDHLGLAAQSIGSNYYDVLPFGYYDAYSGAWFYRSLAAMTELEKAYGDAKRAAEYETLRVEVRKRYNDLYWTDHGFGDGASRYIGCIDVTGNPHDFGFTFLNTFVTAMDLAPRERAEAVLRWLEEGRSLDGSGKWNKDIYKYGFAPRCTTINNPDWWAARQSGSLFPWGEQLQNGGADLYESYYDLMTRLRTRGADDAYQRLLAILRRYAEPDRLTGGSPLVTGESIQGGGTPGSAGVFSYEFPETAMLSAFVLYGFMGAEAKADGLHLHPHLPATQPMIKAGNIYYHGSYLEITATHQRTELKVLPDQSRFDYEIAGQRLVPPFTWRGKAGEVILKPISKKQKDAL